MRNTPRYRPARPWSVRHRPTVPVGQPEEPGVRREEGPWPIGRQHVHRARRRSAPDPPDMPARETPCRGPRPRGSGHVRQTIAVGQPPLRSTLRPRARLAAYSRRRPEGTEACSRHRGSPSCCPEGESSLVALMESTTLAERDFRKLLELEGRAIATSIPAQVTVAKRAAILDGLPQERACPEGWSVVPTTRPSSRAQVSDLALTGAACTASANNPAPSRRDGMSPIQRSTNALSSASHCCARNRSNSSQVTAIHGEWFPHRQVDGLESRHDP